MLLRVERAVGRRHPPYAFTEQGVAMLSSVLRSKRAVQIERTAERDLKSLPTKLFDRIVPRTKPLHYTSILMLHKDGFRRRVL